MGSKPTELSAAWRAAIGEREGAGAAGRGGGVGDGSNGGGRRDGQPRPEGGCSAAGGSSSSASSPKPAATKSFRAKHQRGDSVKWDSYSSVGSVLGGTMANSNIVFEIQNSTAYDITDFADGMAYDVPPNPGRELIIPAGAELEVVDAIEVSPGNWKIVLKQTGAGSI